MVSTYSPMRKVSAMSSAFTRIVFDLRLALELADGLDLHGVDHARAVALGGKPREQGHPVVPGGLHADEDARRLLGQALQPG